MIRQRHRESVLRLGMSLGIGLLVVILLLLAALTRGAASAQRLQESDKASLGSSSRQVDPASTSQGWQTIFTETFQSGIEARWTVTDTSRLDGGQYTWGARRIDPTGTITAAWCVGGGAEGVSLTVGLDDYPEHADSWLIHGPLDLTDAWDAYVEFTWRMVGGRSDEVSHRELVAGMQRPDMVDAAPDQGDWLGWCVLTDVNDLESARCTYVSSTAGVWMRGVIPLAPYLPLTTGSSDAVSFAFRFLSDGDGRVGPGAFLDDIELHVNQGYEAFLPLVRRGAPKARPQNLLANEGFEEREETFHRVLVLPAQGDPREESEAESGILTPPRWLTWYYDDPGEWYQPQVQDMGGAPEQEKQRRIRQGENATLLLTSYRKQDAGFIQQVDVVPGTRLRLVAWAHAWSNNQGGPPGFEEDQGWSEGAGFDCFYAEEGDEGLTSDLENVMFSVGIDPTGGVDPYADTVQWGNGAHIYNCYGQVPAAEVEAQAHRVTVFLRSRAQWAFKHNYAYWDDVELSEVDGAEEAMEWRYPVVAEGSKLGVHGIWNPGPDVLGQASENDLSYAVVKAVDDLGWLSEVEEQHPESVIVARLTSRLEGCPHVEDPATDLDEMANALMSYILNQISLDPALRSVVDYWEVVNEPDPPGTEGYRRLAELMIKCMEKAEMNGLRLALFALNNGTPEWDEMEAMVETGVFEHAREGGHVLALHEGVVWPGEPIDQGWNQGIPGAPDVPGAGQLCFRYRFLYHLLEERNEIVPLIISEWYADRYEEQGGTPQDVVAAVRWYDGLAAQDYWVLGFSPFTVGPSPGWEDADYTFAYPDLWDHMTEVRDRQNSLPPGYTTGMLNGPARREASESGSRR